MRSIWKGSISFGLVNIPVRLYSASQDRELKFIMLHKKDNSEIRYARMCKTEEKEIPWSEIVKAYEIKKGDYVVLSDEDFEKVDIKKVKTIEIFNFAKVDEIDSIYFVKPYFLEPDKNAGSAYALLRDALKKTKKVGIAKYVLRNKEHLAIVKPEENYLILNELRYVAELVDPKELELPSATKSSNKELDMAIKLIDQLTVPFNPEEYSDTYTKELKEIINKKAKGKPVHPKSEEPKSTKVHDIMSLLQASLSTKKKSKKPKKAA